MNAHEAYPDTHHDVYSKTVFGFWLYLLTDFMLFATVFAAFAVLSKSTFGGPTPKELFNLNYTTLETLIFMVSTFTVGIAGVFAHRKKKGGTLIWFAITFLLGLACLWMSLHEFSHLISSGNGWERNAYLSGFFSLTGMFVLHLVFALLWIIVLLIPVFKEGITGRSIRRLACLKMFWQFLSIIWIFIYTIVYLIGIV
ncbi:MAG: cytochrome c oxidase subunit 3 [Chlamydiia bacterium]|nr:cytochrome c oxidase subunit 3 [Chlamydiia bacterium]